MAAAFAGGTIRRQGVGAKDFSPSGISYKVPFFFSARVKDFSPLQLASLFFLSPEAKGSLPARSKRP
jgi:hypothetical protein